jgi:hypothetical protein
MPKKDPRLAHLRPQPNPHTLKRGGPKPKELTLPELDFATELALGARIIDAARRSHLRHSNPYKLYRDERIQNKIKELVAKHESDSYDRVKAYRDELGSFAVRESIHRVRSAKVTRIPAAVLRDMIKDQLQAATLLPVPGVVISNNANATAGAQVQGATALEVYESRWLIERRQQMAKQLEAKYEQPSPPANS